MRNKKQLLISWKELKFEALYDIKVLDNKIQKLRSEVTDLINGIPENFIPSWEEYEKARNERKSLHRLIQVLNRNIEGAEKT